MNDIENVCLLKSVVEEGRNAHFIMDDQKRSSMETRKLELSQKVIKISTLSKFQFQ